MNSLVSRSCLRVVSIAFAGSLTLAACGGGGGSDDSASAPKPAPAPTPTPTPTPTAAISDNVLFSAATAEGVIATISKAGYLRSSDSNTSRQQLNIASGTIPMTGTGASATGNGWLLAGGNYAQSPVSLTQNSDASFYTLKAQGPSGQTTDSTLQLATNLATPTLATLAGNFGINPQYLVTVTGNTFTGLYGYECSWSGTLTPNKKTIDVTHVTFANTSNPTGLACAQTGKEFTGTAFLLASSQAYPRGALVINIDDGGSSVPTFSKLYYFIRP